MLAPRVNVSFTAGEAYGDPSAGRARLLQKIGADPARTVIAGQVHGDRVAWVAARDAGAGALVRGTAIHETDGLATIEKNVGMLITGADCPPVLLYSQKPAMLSLVHSGWRGTAKGIVSKAAAELFERGARPADLKVCIGPGIGVCCYEVGGEVAEQVPRAFYKNAVREVPGARPHLDLGGWILQQLLEAGVDRARIEICDWCTACRTDLFFSHRAEKGRCGRFGLAAMLR